MYPFVILGVITLVTFILLQTINRNDMLHAFVSLIIGVILTYFIVYIRMSDKKDKKGNPPDFALMNRIAEGIGEPCGKVPAAGTFKSIENLDLLPDVFLQPPLWDGGPSQPPKPCGTGEPNCAEIKFDMPEWINHFQILIKSPNRDLSVEVKDPTGQVTPIPIGVNMEDSNKKVDIAAGVTMQRLSRTRAMLVGDQIGRGGAGWADLAEGVGWA